MDIQDGVGRRIVGQRLPGDPDEALVRALIETLNDALDPAEVVREVVLRAVTETRSDRGVLSWIDGNEMIVAWCHDPFGELVPVGSRWPLAGEQVTRLALEDGQPRTARYADVVSLDTVSPPLAKTYRGLKGLLLVPVRVAGEDVAILLVSRRRAEEYDDADSARLATVADVAAHALHAVRLEERLAEAMAELSELAVRSESVELVKTDILRLASHELRSPLTVLNGYLSLVQDGFFGEIAQPLADVMTILQRRTAEMNSLVNDILVAARVEGADDSASGEVSDVNELVRAAARDILPRATDAHRLTLDLPEEPVLTVVDQERLMLALRNIIDNAVKYSPAGGDVVCSVTREEGLARVRVADHGLGIAAEDRDKLFTRFGRVLTTANSHIPGIGLGLYFSREVARRHGGDVVLVDGVEGPGSVFELTLPTAP